MPRNICALWRFKNKYICEYVNCEKDKLLKKHDFSVDCSFDLNSLTKPFSKFLNFFQKITLEKSLANTLSKIIEVIIVIR